MNESPRITAGRTDRRTFLAQTAGALVGTALLPDLAGAVPPPRPGAAPALALVGAGRQGRAILSELQKLDMVDIGAVCDIVPARARAALDRAPAAEAFSSHGEMLARRPDVEGVLIATPTHLHREIVEDCLRAGRHVYCEAPLAHAIDDVEAIVKAAAASDRTFHAGFLARSNPIYRLALGFFRSDAVRDVVTMRAQHHRKTSWRFPVPEGVSAQVANWRLDPVVSSGLAGELGSHALDVARWFRGRDPVRVRGGGAIRLHDDGRTLPDTIAAEFLWDDGVTMRFEATLASSYGGQYEVFQGTNASLRLAWTHGWMFKEADAPTQGWEVYATRQQFHSDEGIVLIADATRLAAQGELQSGGGLPQPPLYYAVADFVRSVLHGTPPPCGAEDGAAATVAGILAHRAIETGEAIDFPAAG